MQKQTEETPSVAARQASRPASLPLGHAARWMLRDSLYSEDPARQRLRVRMTFARQPEAGTVESVQALRSDSHTARTFDNVPPGAFADQFGHEGP